MKFAYLTAGVLLLFWTGSFLQAAEMKWPNKPYIHLSDEQPIDEFLKDFCSSQGVNVIISKAIKGQTVSANFNESAEEVFKKITSAFDLIWYFDGSYLYIYRSDEIKTKIIRFKYITPPDLKKRLTQMDISDPRFPIKFHKTEKIAYVTGPRHYISLVLETVNSLDKMSQPRKKRIQKRQKPEAVAHETLKLFKLKYAWADDKTMSFGNNSVTMPGVATILRNILASADKKMDAPEKNIAPNQGFLAKRSEHKTSADEASTSNAINKRPANPVSKKWHGTVEADPHLNIVIVRDKPEKIPLYEELVTELDVPLMLVEIKASIMDVNLDDLSELGIDWGGGAKTDRNKDDRHYVSTSNLPGSQMDQMAINPPGDLTSTLGKGLNYTTIIGDMADDYLIARLSVMEEDGKANIVSRPSVITFDNVEAQLDHSNTFFVKVSGERNAELFEISAGISLKVTPHIIEEDGKNKIKLSVIIKDGSVSEAKVDEIPVVQNSTINTQAVIDEEESLLIGGLIHENKTKFNRKVPILGDIPLLGYLFSYESVRKTKTERLFMISPRIITQSASD